MGQVIFNLTNFIIPHQFVQNKFVQEFVVVSLLLKKWLNHNLTLELFNN